MLGLIFGSFSNAKETNSGSIQLAQESTEQSSAPAPSAKTSTKKCKTAERTFIAVKPDGVQRGIIGKIIQRFERRGYKMVAIKVCQPGKEHLQKHYADLSKKPFFNDLVDYMNSGPICAMVWEGLDVVRQGRVLLGETNPLASNAASIRGDFCMDLGRNICHGSDAVESAEHEIGLWFDEEELNVWGHHAKDWIYE